MLSPSLYLPEPGTLTLSRMWIGDMCAYILLFYVSSLFSPFSSTFFKLSFQVFSNVGFKSGYFYFLFLAQQRARTNIATQHTMRLGHAMITRRWGANTGKYC